MNKFTFLKMSVVLTCFVAGSLLVGTVATDIDIKYNDFGVSYAQEKDTENQTPFNGQHIQDEMVITLVGDVMLSSRVGQAISLHGPEYPWNHTAEVLVDSDITIANLECPVSERGQPESNKEYTFRATPGALTGAAKAGVDVFTLANNHTLDYGPIALLDTIENIKKNNILYAGAGSNEKEANRPAILDIGKKKVAVLAFSRIIPRSSWIAGEEKVGLASGHNYTLMMDSIQSVRQKADIIVVGMHWGSENEDLPAQKEIEIARALVDAGADIVVGHHPHVLQGIEIYKGKVIAYSLGNFIFTTSTFPKGKEGAIMQVTVSRDGKLETRIFPTQIANGSTLISKGEERKSVLARMNLLCRPFKTSINNSGEIQKIP